MHTLQVAAGHVELSRLGGAAGEADGVELPAQLTGVDLHADVDVRAEDDALRLHLGEPTRQEPLLHLELRDAVAEEAANAVIAFEDGDGVSGAGQLLSAGEAGGAGADDRDGLAGEGLGRLRLDPSLIPSVVDNVELNLLDADCVVVDRQHAGRLTGGGAEPAGEFREVVSGVQPVDSVAPLTAKHEIVPVGDDVPQGAAVLTEGDATVHASSGLLLQVVNWKLVVYLKPIAQTLIYGAPLRRLALKLQESGWLSHVRP